MLRNTDMKTLRQTSDNKGFTLVEVVVVIAVVALLAAIMTPLIAKNIDDSKLARAANETEVISAALGSFYKDVGRWPTRNAAGAFNSANILVSGTTATTAIASGTSNGWDSNTATAGIDFINDHLLTNAIGYPTTGPAAWDGPYLDTVPLDPWGSPYLVNTQATFGAAGTNGAKGIVISAGPDGIVQTPLVTAQTTVPQGDDIAATFAVR